MIMAKALLDIDTVIEISGSLFRKPFKGYIITIQLTPQIGPACTRAVQYAVRAKKDLLKYMASLENSIPLKIGDIIKWGAFNISFSKWGHLEYVSTNI